MGALGLNPKPQPKTPCLGPFRGRRAILGPPRLKEVADKPALASAYVLMSELYESLGNHGKAQKLEDRRKGVLMHGWLFGYM